MSGFEVIRDPKMDKVMEEIISIFHLEGVELVRLSGLVKWCRKESSLHDIPEHAIETIVKKMKGHNIIGFKYIIKCPYCNEKSYIIKYSEDFLKKQKMCDSCNTFYELIMGATVSSCENTLLDI